MTTLTGEDFWSRVATEQYLWKFTDSMLSERSGIPYGTIHTQKARKSLPKADVLLALSEALEVSADYLLTGKVSPHQSEEARLVDEDPDLRALVRAISRDRSLLRLLSGVIQSTEKSANIG